MNITRVLALLPLFVGLAHSFSWDIVVSGGRRLEFYHNGTLTHEEYFLAASEITSVTYDPVQYRVLFAYYHDMNKSISSFDLSTREIQSLVTRVTKHYVWSLAYDPVTQLLFWVDDYKRIYSLSLNPASSNNAVDANLLVTLNQFCQDIAVDSCGGFIYWITDYEIERAAFDGSKREVLLDSEVFGRQSLALDQRTQKMYWIEETVRDQFSIESADLNGKNRRTFYFIGTERFINSLTVSKDYIYWRSYDQQVVLQQPKSQPRGVGPIVYSEIRGSLSCQITAANYTIKEQISGIESCEALKSLILDVEERYGSICQNYCFEGNCSVSAEGHPKCSCNRGYSGERCEIDACHKHCLNDGVCSLNETAKPVCQCTADYQGERCDVSICKDYCLQGNCSVSAQGQPTCRCKTAYSGERCEVNACHEHCLNNGVCSLDETEKPVCQCTADYQGERCDVSICKDYCLQGNCSVSAQGQPTCSCNAGYSGERCEVNACHGHCLNNGDCSLNEEDDPVCQCTADYDGERCEVSASRDNCVSAEGQCNCRCSAGNSGERKVNACHQYCLNDGVCSLNEDSEPVCLCTGDFEGDRCDVPAFITKLFLYAYKNIPPVTLCKGVKSTCASTVV